MSNMVLWGANELPWPRGFQIGVTLDDLMTFLKSGGLGGTLKSFREPMGKPGIKGRFKGWQ